MSYAVKEMFLTLQGEGVQAGRRSVFVRFAGCNLWSGREEDRDTAICRFCDTDFVGVDGDGGGRFTTAGALADAVSALWGEGHDDPAPTRRYVVLTGGEPMLQIDDALIEALHARDFTIAAESNGTIAAHPGIDWLCISPKAGSETVQRSGNELKLVWPQQDFSSEMFENWAFDHFLVQPMDCADAASSLASREAAIALALGRPQWRLTLQAHKALGLR